MVFRVIGVLVAVGGLGGVAVEVVALRGQLVVGVVAAGDGIDAAERRGLRSAVAHGVKRVTRAAIVAVVVGRVAGDGFAVEPVDVVVAPLDGAAALLGCVGADAGCAERVLVVGNGRCGRGKLGKAVERVVGEGGSEAVGNLDRGHIAGVVVTVGGGVLARQIVIHDRREAVLIVPGVGGRDAVRIGGRDGFHFARWEISVAQSASWFKHGNGWSRSVVSPVPNCEEIGRASC